MSQEIQLFNSATATLRRSFLLRLLRAVFAGLMLFGLLFRLIGSSGMVFAGSESGGGDGVQNVETTPVTTTTVCSAAGSCTSQIFGTQVTTLPDGTQIITTYDASYSTGSNISLSPGWWGFVRIEIIPPSGSGGREGREIAVGPPIFSQPPTPSGPPPFFCSLGANPTSGPPGTNTTFNLQIFGDRGSCTPEHLNISWNAPAGCTLTRTGPNSGRATCTFSSSGTYGPYTARVEDLNATGKGGKKGGGCSVVQTTTCSSPQIAISGDLYVDLDVFPPGGTAPLLDVDLMATVGGAATGPINYRFDCTNDGTYDVQELGTSANPYTAFDACDYQFPGPYTARVLVERGGFTAQATTPVVITPAAPGLSCGFSANPTFGPAPLNATFSITDNDPGNLHNNHSYTLGDGNYQRGGQSLTYTYATSGTYIASGALLFCHSSGSGCVSLVDCSPQIPINVGAAQPSPTPPPPPPVIIVFKGNPPSILRGQTTLVTWETENATSCQGTGISGDFDDWNPSAPLPDPKPLDAEGNGSQSMMPTITTVIRLTCAGPGGIASKDATLTVGQVRWREILPRLFFLDSLLARLVNGFGFR